MKRHLALLALALSALSETCLQTGEWIFAKSAARDRDRSNLIVIVTDDHAEWAAGAYGNREILTPNIDRLVREGARFLNSFVVTPVCSPSRATFLTGWYPTQLGITDYLTPEEEEAGVGLPANVTTWPEVLQQHGYVTALLGKWHLGTRAKFHPTRHGYSQFVGFLGGSNTAMNPTVEVDGKETVLQGFFPNLLMNKALEFIERNRSGRFALSIHFREPHAVSNHEPPYYGPVPEEDSTPFRDLDPQVPLSPGIDIQQVKRWTREYYASVHAVDRNIGRLLQRLDDLSLSQRTVVLMTGDNGYMIGHHGLWEKGWAYWIAGGLVVDQPIRPNMFDNSIRVPLVIRWPGVVKPGTEIPEMVSNLDAFVSLLGMLGVPIPKGIRQHGMDICPLLRGEKVKWRDAVFGQYDLHNGGLAYMRMIRTNQWKLVRFFGANGLDELYDLESDPEEGNNLANNPAFHKLREELQKRLTEWQRSISDPILRGK